MGKMCYRCMRPTVENGVCTVCREPALPADGNGANALPPGTTLGKGRLTIGKKLGSGGFGVTYIAFDSKLNRRVALKEFMPNYLAVRQGMKIVPKPNQEQAYQKAMNSFQKEAKTLYELRGHPNIVHVISVFHENNTAYYTMEMLEGESFLDYLKRKKKISAERAFKILLPIMSAIQYTHSKKILHRDISPDNVMLCDDAAHPGRRIPKLIDFGAAHVAIEGFSLSYPGVKKNGFSPLEQNWDGKYQGPWTDVYAFCAMFYSALVGNVPVAALDRAEADKDTLKPPSQLGADISPAMEAVLMRGLKLKYQERTQSMEVLMNDMAAALNQGNTSQGGAGKTAIEINQATPRTASRPVGQRIGAWILEQVLSIAAVNVVPMLMGLQVSRMRDLDSLLAAGLETYAMVALVPAFFWLLDWLLMATAGGTLGQLIFGLKARRSDGGGNPGVGGSCLYALFYNSYLSFIGFILGIIWLASGKSIGPMERMANIMIGRRNEREVAGMAVAISQGVVKSEHAPKINIAPQPDDETIGPGGQPKVPSGNGVPSQKISSNDPRLATRDRVSGQQPGPSQAARPVNPAQRQPNAGQPGGARQPGASQMVRQPNSGQQPGQSQMVRSGHPAQRQPNSGNAGAQQAPGTRGILLVRQAAESAAAIQGKTVALRDGITLGKNAQKAEIVIQDQTVSGLHCVFHFVQGRGWMIEDKGSTNGTFLGDVKLGANTPVALRSGSILKIGKEVLEFRML